MNKAEIKAVLGAAGLAPQKKFGQNFLLRTDLAEKLVDALELKKGEHVIEIGPGLGALTDVLVKRDAHITLVEKDRGFSYFLTERYASLSPPVTIRNMDFLEYDFSDVKKGERTVVVGNLPYYVSTPILFHVIEFRERVSKALFTLQREVIDRMVAKPGSEHFGRLSAAVQFFADTKKVEKIPRRAFFPEPNVDSAAVLLTFRPWPGIPKDFSSDLYLRVVKAAFSTRRKFLANALTQGENGFPESAVREALRVSRIPEKARAEDLSIADFVAVTRSIDM